MQDAIMGSDVSQKIPPECSQQVGKDNMPTLMPERGNLSHRLCCVYVFELLNVSSTFMRAVTDVVTVTVQFAVRIQ